MDMGTEITTPKDIIILILGIIMEMGMVTDMDNKARYLFLILQIHLIQTGFILNIITSKAEYLYLAVVMVDMEIVVITKTKLHQFTNSHSKFKKMKKLIFFLTILFFKANLTFANYESGVQEDGPSHKSVALYVVIVLVVFFILALSLRGKKGDKENGREE